jgi:hypothetical protein
VSPWKDPNIPLEVIEKIGYNFKEVSTTAKTYIEQNKVHQCFKSTLNTKNKNEKMFRLKNRVKFRVTGEGE